MTTTRSTGRLALAGLASLALLSSCGLLGGTTVATAEVGDCFTQEALESEQISELPTIACDEPHFYEAYHLFDLPDGDYPGLTEVQSLAGEGCEAAFADYVGTEYAESSLFIQPLHPLEDGWDRADDREVICILTSGEDVTESLKDSGL